MRLNSERGTIALVGAGPGDPRLLTLHALELIHDATLVIADKLISKDIINLIKCKVVIADWKHGNAEEAQLRLNSMVVTAVKSGEKVVRLKIGDPFLFGRGAEEVLEYRKYGLEPIIVSGISSALAAPAAAMVPITHRDVAQQMLICTGYGRNGSSSDLPEYHARRTVVLLMAVGRLAEIASELTELKSFPGDVPVRIIENATMSSQRVTVGTLNNIAQKAMLQGVQSPAVVVIGAVNNVLHDLDGAYTASAELSGSP